MKPQVDPSRTTNLPKVDDQAYSQIVKLSIQTAAVMFGCSAGYAGYFTWRAPHNVVVPLLILIGIPAIGALLYILTTQAFKDLLAPRKLVFPLTITLPIVFNALVFITSVLLTTTGNSLIAPFEQLRVAEFWMSPGVLCLVTFSQIVCLLALASLSHRPVDS